MASRMRQFVKESRVVFGGSREPLAGRHRHRIGPWHVECRVTAMPNFWSLRHGLDDLLALLNRIDRARGLFQFRNGVSRQLALRRVKDAVIPQERGLPGLASFVVILLEPAPEHNWRGVLAFPDVA